MNNHYHRYIYLATCLAITLSFCYLVGFWNTFDINIFEYISISDIVREAIYPLIISFAFSIIGYIWGFRTPSNYVDDSKIQHMNVHIRVIVVVNAILCGILIYLKQPSFWMFGGFVFIFLMFELFKTTLITISLQYNLNPAIIFIMGFMMVESVCFGKIDSYNILQGHDTFWVSSRFIQNKDISSSDKKFKYISLEGNYVFLLSENNKRIVLVRTSEIPALELTKKEYGFLRDFFTK